MTRLQKISILRNAFEMILNFTIIYEYYGIGILLSQEKKEMGILSSLQCKMQKFVTIPKIIGKKWKTAATENQREINKYTEHILQTKYEQVL